MIKFALLILAVSATLAPAAEPVRRLRIFSTKGWTTGVHPDLLGPLERVLRDDPNRVSLERVDYEMLYYSGGRYLLEVPKGLPKDRLPAGAVSPRGTVDILETQRSILMAEPAGEYPLLEKLLAAAQDGRDTEAYRPGARRAKGRLGTMSGPDREFRFLDLEGAPPRGPWQWNFAMRYGLLVDGKPVTVTILGKPYGGLSAALPALARRLDEIKEPSLLVNLGTVGLPEQYRLDPAKTARLMLDAGLRLVAFSADDIENAWDALLRFAGEGPPELRAILLATNFRPKDPTAPNPVRRYQVESLDGVKVGIISLLSPGSDLILRRKNLPWSITDPIAAARETVEELRFVEKVDLVVAVTHLTTEEAANLNQVPGVDLIIGNTSGEISTRRRTVVEVEEWRRENHYSSILEARAPYFSFGELAVDLRPRGAGWEPARVEELIAPVDAYAPRDPAIAAIEERVYGFFDAARRPVLPDSRALWPSSKKPRTVYRETDAWNIAAQALRRKSGAEVALLRVNWLNSSAPGVVTESFAATWFDAPERVVRFKLDGASLRSLLPRVIYDVDPDHGDERRHYEEKVWLAQAGLDEKGLVHGLPIRDGEIYEVAATEDLLRKTDELPGLGAATDVRTEPATLRDWILPALIDRYAAASVSTAARSAYESELRVHAAGETPEAPVWRLHLRELSAQFSNTQLHNEGPFNQVKDARIQSVSQVQGQGTARLFSEYYRRRWRWDVGATARYGKVILRQRDAPPLENKTQDQFLAETELRHQTWRFERRARGYSAGPFVNASYDTEFTPPVTPGVPIRRFLALKPGFKVFEGARLKDLRVSGVIQRDYSTPLRRTFYGFETGFEWTGAMPRSKATLTTKANYLQFAPSRHDTAADLRRQLELSAKIAVPIVDNLSLSPFADFFLFDSKVLPQRGYNLVFGVSLEFSRLWKPVY